MPQAVLKDTGRTPTYKRTFEYILGTDEEVRIIC